MQGVTDIKNSASSVFIKAFNKHILLKMGIDVEYNIIEEGYEPFD